MNFENDQGLQRAVRLHGEGAAAQAAVIYERILQGAPDHPDALHLLGVAKVQLGSPAAGLDLIERSLKINGGQPVAHANRGNALMALGKPEEALTSYDRAATLWPGYAPAHHGRGNALSLLGRPGEALLSFDRALEIAPDFLEAQKARAAALIRLGRIEEAVAAYDGLLRRHPDSAELHCDRGSALLAMQRTQDALQSFERASSIDSGSLEALIGRGLALAELRQTDAAVAAYDQVLRLRPSMGAALFYRGIALSVAARYEDAIASLRRMSAADPLYQQALGARLHAEMQVCDWTDHEQTVREICGVVGRGGRMDHLGSFIAAVDSPSLQLEWARVLGDTFRLKPRPLWGGGRYEHERIRIAYVSADFLEHPTSYLMAGLFEKHDKTRFETIAVSLRDDPRSPMAQRLRAAFDHYLVVGARSDAEIARQIRDLDVDIAVDLMGYTAGHRTQIFSYRPAPVQINMLGYPATMGTADLDYIIADEFLIPPENRPYYREQVIYLPECFQVTDDTRPGTAQPPTRAAMGLPQQGFVWAAFHSSYKLNPGVFGCWMRSLCAVPDGVLWLVGGNRAAERNLRREAAARGVDPQRLVFAERLPYPEHLARLRLADLCLDALPYTGGATSSDALWAGVPVLTCVGQSFSARMSASLLHALGLPELIADNLEHYERLAVQLARTPDRLAEVRARLSHNAVTGPVFNTDRFRRHLEAAFTAVVARSRRGEPPMTLRVEAERS